MILDPNHVTDQDIQSIEKQVCAINLYYMIDSKHKLTLEVSFVIISFLILCSKLQIEQLLLIIYLHL